LGSANLISNVKKLSNLHLIVDKLETIDIHPLIEEVIINTKAGFPTKQFTINTNILSGKYLVKGNALLMDVFANLLNNSAKFDHHDNVEIDIVVSPLDEKKSWRVDYSDRGPGIDDKRKETVFNRLERGDSDMHGSGLGLTLVKQIVESYGGSIWIEDRVKGSMDQGCNFVILLPRGV